MNEPPFPWVDHLPAEWREWVRVQVSAVWAEAVASATKPPALNWIEPPPAYDGTAEMPPASPTRRRKLFARGEPERLVIDAFKRISPREATPVEIGRHLAHNGHAAMPSSTLSRTIHALADRGLIKQFGQTTAFVWAPQPIPPPPPPPLQPTPPPHPPDGSGLFEDEEWEFPKTEVMGD